MKKLTILVFSLFFLNSAPVLATKPNITEYSHDDNSHISHSGRTNAEGCHNDRKLGTYHCH